MTSRDAETSRLEALAQRHGIRLLLQFGSSVSERTHPGSDVDLAVLRDGPPLSFREHAELAHDLQPLFPRVVDVVDLLRADPLLLKQIVTSARRLYGTPAAHRRLEIYAFKRYQDHRPFLDMERRFVARRLGGHPR